MTHYSVCGTDARSPEVSPLNASKADNSSKSLQEIAAEAMFGEGAEGPPPTEESNHPTLDEFRAASISAPPFTAERPSHLGGPRERIRPAMPASVVRRQAPGLAPDSDADSFDQLDFSDNTPTAPGAPEPAKPTAEEQAAVREQRLRDSRRGRSEVKQEDSRALQAILLITGFLMLVVLIILFLGPRA